LRRDADLNRNFRYQTARILQRNGLCEWDASCVSMTTHIVIVCHPRTRNLQLEIHYIGQNNWGTAGFSEWDRFCVSMTMLSVVSVSAGRILRILLSTEQILQAMD
jgi:hypothetical protein